MNGFNAKYFINDVEIPHISGFITPRTERLSQNYVEYADLEISTDLIGVLDFHWEMGDRVKRFRAKVVNSDWLKLGF